MIREVKLENYIPEFMREYKEPAETLKAENPEFNLVWKAADKVLCNRFILTADEDGISRFEKLLGIFPAADDTLESRRLRVQNRWFNTIPYTMKALVQKLTLLCSETDFAINHNFESGYTLTINTGLEGYGEVGELEQIMDSMIPCNIAVEAYNHIKVCGPEQVSFLAGAAASCLMVDAANYTEQAVQGGNI